MLGIIKEEDGEIFHVIFNSGVCFLFQSNTLKNTGKIKRKFWKPGSTEKNHTYIPINVVILPTFEELNLQTCLPPWQLE